MQKVQMSTKCRAQHKKREKKDETFRRAEHVYEEGGREGATRDSGLSRVEAAAPVGFARPFPRS